MILLLVIPVASAFGDDYDDYEDDYGDYDYAFIDYKNNVASDCNDKDKYTNDIFKTGCDGSQSTKQLCKCVRRQAERNILIKANLNNNLVITESITKMQTEYTKKFVNVFSQMTIEADVQESILGIGKPDNGKIANCTPALFAGRVKTNMVNHFKEQDALLKDMLVKKTKQYKNRCEKLGFFSKVARFASLAVNGKEEQENRDNTDCARRKAELDLINKNITREPISEADGQCHDSASKLTKIAIEKRLEIAIKHYEDTRNGEMAKNSRKMLSDIKIRLQFQVRKVLVLVRQLIMQHRFLLSLIKSIQTRILVASFLVMVIVLRKRFKSIEKKLILEIWRVLHTLKSSYVMQWKI